MVVWIVYHLEIERIDRKKHNKIKWWDMMDAVHEMGEGDGIFWSHLNQSSELTISL